jgi:hypothetical protein
MQNKESVLFTFFFLLLQVSGIHAEEAVLQVDKMTPMLQGFVLQNNNGGLYAANSDFKTTPNGEGRMIGYGGVKRRGMVYQKLQDALGLERLRPGTYTLTVQVAMNRDDWMWAGMWDTDTSWFDRNATGFFAGFFMQPDASGRVAYTVERINKFNQMDGVTLQISSDSAVDVLEEDPNIPPRLEEDTWYDVVYEWTISPETAAMIGAQPVYIGFGGAIGNEKTSLWLANAKIEYISQ